jgi:hypothetical protein
MEREVSCPGKRFWTSNKQAGDYSMNLGDLLKTLDLGKEK